MTYKKYIEKNPVLRCPNCNLKHKRRPTGEYCNMTCYYAKLRKDVK